MEDWKLGTGRKGRGNPLRKKSGTFHMVLRKGLMGGREEQDLGIQGKGGSVRTRGGKRLASGHC